MTIKKLCPPPSCWCYSSLGQKEQWWDPGVWRAPLLLAGLCARSACEGSWLQVEGLYASPRCHQSRNKMTTPSSMVCPPWLPFRVHAEEWSRAAAGWDTECQLRGSFHVYRSHQRWGINTLRCQRQGQENLKGIKAYKTMQLGGRTPAWLVWGPGFHPQSKKQKQKQNKTKELGCSPVVENLPSMVEALGTIPSTKIKIKKTGKWFWEHHIKPQLLSELLLNKS